MKKMFVCIAAFAALFASCATGGRQEVAGITVDQAILEVVSEIERAVDPGSTIAVLNFDSPSDRFSEYVIDGITMHLVRGRIFTVVNRSELDRIRGELDFNMSGDVSDDSAQHIGRMLGAQVIVTGSLTEIAGLQRMTTRVLHTETAALVGMRAANIANDTRTQALLAGGRTGGPAVAANRPAAQTTVQAGGGPAAAAPAQVAAQRPVVTVQGADLAEKLQWVAQNAQRNTEYRIEVAANENLVPHNLFFDGRNNITVRLASAEGARMTVTHTGGTGSLFTVGSGVELVLANITLHGRAGNNAPVVMVAGGGSLVMDGEARITGNVSSAAGGGVNVAQNASFTMNGGEIFGNSAGDGGGVSVRENASFTMRGGEIFGNSAQSGGGVYTAGNFTMHGGEIFGNSSNESSLFSGRGGGGVFISVFGGNFTMNGGIIEGNTARAGGGGVAVAGRYRARFTMNGGEINGNIAAAGGGVFLAEGVMGATGSFTKTGGTIHGFADGGGNRATGGGNTHAVGSQSGNILRISTAGPNVNLNTANSGAAGGWEN